MPNLKTSTYFSVGVFVFAQSKFKMKKIIYSILLLFPLLVQGQAYTIQYKVYINVVEATGILHIDPSKGSFYSVEVKYVEPRVIKSEDTKNGNNSMETIIAGYGSEKKSYQIYPVMGDTLVNVDFIGGWDNQAIYNEKFVKMKWDIKDSTKTISNYKCQKATTNFRGREYTAWFTPELPIKVGPWKFNNLPGAILQVYDQSKRYSWNAEKISQSEDAEQLPDFKGLKKYSIKDYVSENIRLKKENEKNRLERSLRRKYGNEADIHINIEDIKVTGGLELKYEWEE